MQDLCQTHSIKLRQEASYNSFKPATAEQSVCEEVVLSIYALLKVKLQLKIMYKPF